MTPLLRIPATLNLAAVEEKIAELDAAGECAIELPTKIRHTQFGGAAALLQLIFTWARRNPQGVVQYRGTALPDFIAQDHGLVAALMGGAVRPEEEADQSREAIALAKQRLDAMDTVDGARRGEKVFVACADHLELGAPQSLYRRTEDVTSLKSQQGYESLIRQVFAALIRGEGVRRDPGAVTVHNVASAVRELVSNTNDWGAYEVEDDGDHVLPLPRSVRGVRVAAYSHKLQDHVRIAKGEPLLTSYLLKPDAGAAERQQRMFEISIFDSGPGIPSRQLRRAKKTAAAFGRWPFQTGVSLAEEAEAVKECLKVNFTTSASSHRGDGLHQVMNMMSALNGFVRIRSGRLALYRDFLAHAYNPENIFEPYLFDWNTHKRNEFSEHAPAWGSVVTFIFPVPA